MDVSDAQIHDGSLPWGTRLKIAKEIANAVTYLHNKFPRPIIHRDIEPANIFLNQHYDAKLVDFALAISIPEGESHVEDSAKGTIGFLDPDCYITNFVTEKTDAYSFGVLLLVLITGKGAAISVTGMLLIEYVKDLVEKDQINEVVDPTISGEDRPLMIEVEKEIQRIERSITAL